MDLRAVLNCCLVKIEKRYQDQDGNITIDPTWRPEEYATLEGTVVSVPLKIDGEVTGSLRQGDKIVFSYCVVYDFKEQPDNATPIYKNLVIINGEEYWIVDVEEIFFKLTDKIEMVTDNCLIEPFEFKAGDTISNGLLIKNNRIENKGIIKGLPAYYRNARVGDTVFFEPRFVQKYNILGKEHFIIPIRRMLAKAN